MVWLKSRSRGTEVIVSETDVSRYPSSYRIQRREAYSAGIGCQLLLGRCEKKSVLSQRTADPSSKLMLTLEGLKSEWIGRAQIMVA